MLKLQNVHMAVDSALGYHRPANEGATPAPKALPRMVFLNERRVRSIELTKGTLPIGNGDEAVIHGLNITLVPEPQKSPLVLKYRFSVPYDAYTIFLHNEASDPDASRPQTQRDALTCREAGHLISWTTF